MILIVNIRDSERKRCAINARHPEERRRRDVRTQFYMCEAHINLKKLMNEKILKNLLIYAGSPRPPAGGLGMTGAGGRFLETSRVTGTWGEY
jgi:hypothetical protein